MGRIELTRSLQSLADVRTLLLIGLLLFNDHVLRVGWPAWWTGKLGDAAWLGFAPLLLTLPLAILLPRAWPRRGEWVVGLSIAGVGATFALAKVLPAGHAAVSGLFTWVFGWRPGFRLDPTDLLALPALLIPLRIWRTHPHASSRPSRLRALGAVALGCLATLANTPAEPCDVPVESPEPIERAARSDAFVEALTAEFTLTDAQVEDCFVNGEVEVFVSFELPDSYSIYGFPYSTWVHVLYLESGSTRVELDQHHPAHARTPEALIDEVQRAIRILETDPRFVELVQKVDFTDMWPGGYAYADNVQFNSSYPIGPDERYRGPSMLLKWEAGQSEWILRAYEVPTAFSWNAYPEVERAKQLAQQRLREEAYRSCSLVSDDVRFPTHSHAVRASANDPWSVRIQLHCGDHFENLYFDLEG